MTDISTPPDAQQVDTDTPPCPSVDLLNLIVAFLTPMFLGGSTGDIRMARLAAIEMVCAYRAYSYVDLLTVVQLVAFSLTTLDSLSLSMGGELSLSMILRLRGNANALHRSAERHRCTLATSQQDLAARQDDLAACQHDPAARQHDDSAPREVPPHPPIPASAFQATSTPAATKASPPEPQAPLPSAPPSAITPQGLHPSTALFPEPASPQTGMLSCHLAPPRQVSIRAAALGSSASHLMTGAAPLPPFVYNADARTT